MIWRVVKVLPPSRLEPWSWHASADIHFRSPSRLSFVTWYAHDTRSIEMAEIDGTTYKQLQDVCPCRAVMRRAPNGKIDLPDVACHDLDQQVQVSRREVHLVGR